MSGEGIVPPSDYEEPSSTQESPYPTQHTGASSPLNSTLLQQAIPPPTPGSRNTQESQIPHTSASNSRYSRRQLTTAELSQLFLHSTSSRAERQQDTWDEMLQCLRSQITVGKEIVGLLKEIREELLHLGRRITRH